MSDRKPDDKLLKVSGLAKATGLSKQTIHYYLMLGLITESARSAGGHRLFDQRVVDRVKVIHQANQSGYALRDIREVFLKNKN